jgi:hypothetical protein
LQTSRPTLSNASGGRQKVDKQLQDTSSRESPYVRALRLKTGNRGIARTSLVRRVVFPPGLVGVACELVEYPTPTACHTSQWSVSRLRQVAQPPDRDPQVKILADWLVNQRFGRP